jgi:hypothetical protein
MRTRVLCGILLFGCLIPSSQATTISNGVFDFSGTIYVTIAEATPVVTAGGTCPANQSCIFWADSSGNNPSGDSGTLGGMVDISTAGLPNGDIPTAIAGNDAANISTLVNLPDVVGSGGFTPEVFMSFNNDAITTTLSIDNIASGVFPTSGCTSTPPAAGQLCTPAGSPFSFLNTSNSSSSATYLFSGVTNAGGTWTADFTSPFATESFQQVLAALATNGYFDDTFSAQLTLTTPVAATPEPGTLTAMIAGIALIGLVAARRRFSGQVSGAA